MRTIRSSLLVFRAMGKPARDEAQEQIYAVVGGSPRLSFGFIHALTTNTIQLVCSMSLKQFVRAGLFQVCFASVHPPQASYFILENEYSMCTVEDSGGLAWRGGELVHGGWGRRGTQRRRE
jgi:hypothetical protein